MTTTETIRNATMADLVTLLRDQQGRKVDAVVPAHKLTAGEDGLITVAGIEAQVDEDGVTAVDGHYRPTEVMTGHLAEKLGIPAVYLRRMQGERPDLWAANLNGWLHGSWPTNLGQPSRPEHYTAQPDPRSFLLRAFRPADGDGPGVGRALLSDTYRVIDHIDTLTAALDGVRAADVDVQVGQCDLTDSRMYIKVHAPSVAALAPNLLAGYRSPFSGQSGADNPTVFAGFVLKNSETGGGAVTLTPQITVQICTNGMTLTRDAVRAVHLGHRLDTGIVRASEETQLRQLALIRSQAADAVRTFLDVDYVTRKIAELEEDAGVRVTRPDDTITHVATTLQYTRQQQDDVLSMFIEGADLTAGGVMHAVTAAAQRQADADAAHAMEADALPALAAAAAFASAN